MSVAGVIKGESGLLTVIPDANVLIHGKPLADLPWTELGRPAIEVLFVPPIVRELDKLKNQAGRPNKIARQLSSDIRALINAPDRRTVLLRSQPAVSKRVELQRVTDALNASLRLDHADHALINYALHLKQKGADVLLLTDDTICGTTAQEVGLSTHFLPVHWLREPEPDESGKENAKLRAEIQRLSMAEPKVQLSFRDQGGEPLAQLESSVTRWPALTGTELDSLMQDIRQRCPQATSFEREQPRATQQFEDSLAALEGMSKLASSLSQLSQLFTSGSFYEPANEEEIERYKTSEYPNWLSSVRKMLESLHLRLTAQTHWPTVVAAVANVGTRPATETLLKICVFGAFAIRNDESDIQDSEGEDWEANGNGFAKLELPLPPKPPRGHVKKVGIDPSAFDIASPRSSLDRLARSCSQNRAPRAPQMLFIGEPDDGIG
jgi:PIN domain